MAGKMLNTSIRTDMALTLRRRSWFEQALGRVDRDPPRLAIDQEPQRDEPAAVEDQQVAGRVRFHRLDRSQRPSGGVDHGGSDQLVDPELVVSVQFFFQAEDGIRDGRVTGVQTCALPIFATATAWRISSIRAHCPAIAVDMASLPVFTTVVSPAEPPGPSTNDPWWNSDWESPRPRSEERRVGKECKCRWVPDA